MTARSIGFTVRNSDDKVLSSQRVPWWDTRIIWGHPLFTRVDAEGYTDWIAHLTLAEFVALNREHIQRLSSYDAVSYYDEITDVITAIHSGDWDDATITVTMEEWESGLS